MQPKDQIENRREHNQVPSTIIRESMMNHKMSTDPGLDGSSNDHARNDSKMIDLNMRPARAHGQTSNTQVGILNSLTYFFISVNFRA